MIGQTLVKKTAKETPHFNHTIDSKALSSQIFRFRNIELVQDCFDDNLILIYLQLFLLSIEKQPPNTFGYIYANRFKI